jgi:hypothetical protein
MAIGVERGAVAMQTAQMHALAPDALTPMPARQAVTTDVGGGRYAQLVVAHVAHCLLVVVVVVVGVVVVGSIVRKCCFSSSYSPTHIKPYTSHLLTTTMRNNNIHRRSLVVGNDLSAASQKRQWRDFRNF